mmetsp:Transcript_84400/g.116642  ORF Transcript_84400/g.116642 Transcript_84400/m.116642 type:complete len:304 (-) Transcript_84400:533-1444(-)
MLHMVVINVRNTLGNLRARYASVKVKHLGTNLLHHISCCLDGHKFIIKRVASSDDFNIIDVVTVNSWQAHTAVVHLSSKHFIAKEPVTEDTTITVGTVQALSSGHINQITKHSMHRVILLLDIVDMLGMLVNLVAAEHSLKKEEAVEVFMLPARSIVEYTDAGVDHFIVTDKEETRVIDWRLSVFDRLIVGSWESREVLLTQVNKLLMVYGTSTDNDHVFTIVIGVAEIHNHFTVDLSNVVNITKNRLTHHMFSINVIVNVFHQGLLRVLVGSFQLLPDCVLFQFQMVIIKHRIAKHITENLN